MTCWPTSREAEAAMEQQGVVGALLQEDLAGELRIAQLRVALHVGVERADAAATAAAGHHHAVDVEEMRVALAEPGEVAAVVRGIGPSRSGNRPASHRARPRGILGRLEQATHPAGVEGRIAGPAALFRARTESSSCSRTSRMAIDITYGSGRVEQGPAGGGTGAIIARSAGRSHDLPVHAGRVRAGYKTPC